MKLGHIWCADTSDLWGKSFQFSVQQCALGCCHCCGRVTMSVSGFLAQMEFPSFFKVLDIKQWSCLNFQASFSVDSPFSCPLRQFNGASSLPSICICHFPTACLSFNVSSLLIIPQNSIEGVQGKFKVQKMPNCV